MWSVIQECDAAGSKPLSLTHLMPCLPSFLFSRLSTPDPSLIPGHTQIPALFSVMAYLVKAQHLLLLSLACQNADFLYCSRPVEQSASPVFPLFHPHKVSQLSCLLVLWNAPPPSWESRHFITPGDMYLIPLWARWVESC